ncbi:MAG: hypothetical protein WBW73_24315 [Rhodoplanes sp.]
MTSIGYQSISFLPYDLHLGREGQIEAFVADFRWRLATSPASKISQRLREKPKPPLMCYLRGRCDSARVKRISDRERRSALKGLVSGES